MKKVLIIVLLFAFISLISVGCANGAGEEASIQEIDITSIKDKQFVKLLDQWTEKNGAYLFQYQKENNQDYYVFLNAFHVEQGAKATTFEGFKVDIDESTMHIYYTEKEAAQGEKLKNRILYRIPTVLPSEYVRIYKNGEETHFETVGVIGGKPGKVVAGELVEVKDGK